jgi:hypothetical protein
MAEVPEAIVGTRTVHQNRSANEWPTTTLKRDAVIVPLERLELAFGQGE